MPKREPVLLEKKGWVEARELTVMGADPGFASMGLAVLTQARGSVVICQHLSVAATKKSSKKQLRNLRVADDDQRRIRELHNCLCDVAARFPPHAIAYEVYQPFKGRMGGNAWKSARVEGLVQCFGLERSVLVLPFLPQDIKRAFTGKVKAEKVEVEDALRKKIVDFARLIDQIDENDREHAADAAAHAYLAFEEMSKMRQMTGLG